MSDIYSGENAYQYLMRFMKEALTLTIEEKETLKQLKTPIEKKFKKECRITSKDIIKLGSFMDELKAPEDLTATEEILLELLCKGFSYNECSQKTGSCLTTIKTHANAIFEKRGIHSLQELIVLELTGQLKGIYRDKNKKDNYKKDPKLSDAEKLLHNLLG